MPLQDGTSFCVDAIVPPFNVGTELDAPVRLARLVVQVAVYGVPDDAFVGIGVFQGNIQCYVTDNIIVFGDRFEGRVWCLCRGRRDVRFLHVEDGAVRRQNGVGIFHVTDDGSDVINGFFAVIEQYCC